MEEAKSMGLAVIAERVETIAQPDFLAKHALQRLSGISVQSAT